MAGLNLLQINFSNLVELEVIQALRTNGLNSEHVISIKNLIEDAGGDQLMAVYELSADEIVHDRYGFARTFKLYLKPDADMSRAIKLLQSSPLVESVKPVGISKTFHRS
jgi:hypothetical protein